MQAFEQGYADCLEGIVAGARWLPATEENKSILHKAHRLAADLDPRRREALIQHFRPPGEQEPANAIDAR